MAETPEISGQDSGTIEVNNLAAELDAPDDVQVGTPETPAATPEAAPETPEVPVSAPAADAKADGTPETPEAPAVEEPPAKEPSPEQLQLIQLVRQMRKELSLANAKQQRQEAELQKLRQGLTKATDDLDDDDLLGSGRDKKQPTVAAPEPLSELEQLQQDLSQIGQQRSEQLITLVETMAVSPKYEDVREVCSRNNLNDLVDAMAAKLATDHGIDPVLAALKVETAIWQQPNPYAWMYETIKAHHPKYAKATTTPAAAKEAPAPATAETKPRLPAPAEAPPSVLPLGPTDTSQGTGWTAAKLDAMDELELIKVPDNIRQQYLTGQLQ